MKTHYVLVDYENVKVAHVEKLRDERFRVILFLGLHDTKLPVDLVLAMQQLHERGSYIVLESAGRNALDFHIAYYLGALTTQDPTGFFHIVSKDAGYDPLIRHLKAQGIQCARSPSVDELPCFVANGSTAKPADPPAAPKPETPPRANASLEALVRVAAGDLIKRKTARPRKEQTLRSTIHAACGKQLPASQIEKVYQELVRRGWVKVSGTAVTYDLPAQVAADNGVGAPP